MDRRDAGPYNEEPSPVGRVGDGAPDVPFWDFDGMRGVYVGAIHESPQNKYIVPTGMGSFVNDPYKIIRGGIGIQQWTVEAPSLTRSPVVGCKNLAAQAQKTCILAASGVSYRGCDFTKKGGDTDGKNAA